MCMILNTFYSSEPNTAPDHMTVVHCCISFTSWFLKMWLFPYPYGFCNPVQIYGRKINDLLWYDMTTKYVIMLQRPTGLNNFPLQFICFCQTRDWLLDKTHCKLEFDENWSLLGHATLSVGQWVGVQSVPGCSEHSWVFRAFLGDQSVPG